MSARLRWIVCALGLGSALAAAPAFAELPEVEETCAGKVRLHGPLWDLEAVQLQPGLGEILDTVARAIRERCGGKSIVIESHAYEMGSPELNQRLSELRAALVRDELVKRGVPAAQLMPIGLGDTRPLVPLDGAEGRRENRRVTFRVLD